MLRTAQALQGDTIVARDGEIGHVDQFYFDDEKWVVRYLVVATGGWLTGRQVLISPIAIERADLDSEKVHLTITRDQVQNSPDWSTDRPVSRQQEAGYYRYYGWPYYWGGLGLWGYGAYPGYLRGPSAYPGYLVPPPEGGVAVAEEVAARAEEQDDPHLRSTKEVTGYPIHARDGEIGKVDDFLIDDETWAIRYLAVDTGGWLPGKKVLVAPRWIEQVSWTEREVSIDLLRDQIESAPEWDPSRLVTRADEERLYTHYDRPHYW